MDITISNRRLNSSTALDGSRIETDSKSKTLSSALSQFQGFRKLKKIQGYKVEIDSANSLSWLVTSDGIRLRPICGHSGLYGPCLLSPGWGTNHSGFGKCRHHSRRNLYNVTLSQSQNIPARLSELLEATELLEDKDLSYVDAEIKMLYALQTYVMTIGPELTLDQVSILKDLATDLVKAKALKNKIQRELRLDASSVKEFVEQIFTIISTRVRGPEAKNILNDIMNEVIIPFRNQDRIKPGDVDPRETVNRFIKRKDTIKGLEEEEED